jgi:hypothetical protein
MYALSDPYDDTLSGLKGRWLFYYNKKSFLPLLTFMKFIFINFKKNEFPFPISSTLSIPHQNPPTVADGGLQRP